MNHNILDIDNEAWLEATNIHKGVLNPLKGFMNEAEYHSVVKDMRLLNGSPWTLPISLEIPESLVKTISLDREVELKNNGVIVGRLSPTQIFKINFESVLVKIFKTDDLYHPGVKKEKNRSPFRIAGEISLDKFCTPDMPVYSYWPEDTKRIFKENGWKTVVGFQTRNPPHRAHEYLQRVGMEMCDGIFVQPLTGWKKTGDFTPQAVLGAYQIMMDDFYPKNSLLGCLNLAMRYAGPREAVFHAIIRKNFGCTHFIVGRDHAGVGNYYGKYEAQNLCLSIKDLGITILPLAGPYYCKKCLGIATEKSCQHSGDDIFEISGTYVRKTISSNERPNEFCMREKVSDFLIDLNKNSKLFF